MKLFYPYFNLFVKSDTQNYRLDVLIKLPGNYKLDVIIQEWSDPAWMIKFYFEADENLETVGNVQLQEYSINLTPGNLVQLEKIKMLVYSIPRTQAIIENTASEGEGETGSGEGVDD